MLKDNSYLLQLDCTYLEEKTKAEGKIITHTGEYKAVITTKDYDQNCTNKTKVVIKQNYPLSWMTRELSGTKLGFCYQYLGTKLKRQMPDSFVLVLGW